MKLEGAKDRAPGNDIDIGALGDTLEKGPACNCTLDMKREQSAPSCDAVNWEERNIVTYNEEKLGWSSICLLSLYAAALASLTFLLSLSLLRLSNTILSPTFASSRLFPTGFLQQEQPESYADYSVGEESSGSTWEGLKGAEHCLRFATRDYTAKLVNVPSDVSRIKACRETPVEIHGISLFPDYCQDLGLAGGVWGHWTITFEEPACLTSWGDFIDMGCDDQGRALLTRRFEAALENMQHGDNWQIMCTTTPAELRGFHFPTPTMCERWGKEEVVGVWEVDDLACTPS